MNEINESNTEIMSNHELKLIDFYAEYCAPCHQLKPLLERISSDENYNSEMGFFGVNVEENPDMCITYQIKSVPTIVIVKGNTEVKRVVGQQNEKNIRDIIEQFVKK